MANTNNHFTTYNSNITLTDTRKENLIVSRNELRNRVKNWFKSNKPDLEQPSFKEQGSMAMETVINPIPQTVEKEGKEVKLVKYDVDDGIYFEGVKDIKDRPTTSTYHSWIVQAVDGHTDVSPIDKNTCVRTIFSDGHNVDQPIYYKQGDKPELAHKREGYIISDPTAFSEWFNEKAKNQQQLRRLVRYAKGWCDTRQYINSQKPMPSGLIMTILITNNAMYRENRDDIALKETLVCIESALTKKFECFRPTTPDNEDLLAEYPQKDYFMSCLRKFIDDAEKALEENNIRKSTELWRQHLSDRFPLGEDKDEETKSKTSTGLASFITPTSKPYCE